MDKDVDNTCRTMVFRCTGFSPLFFPSSFSSYKISCFIPYYSICQFMDLFLIRKLTGTKRTENRQKGKGKNIKQYARLFDFIGFGLYFYCTIQIQFGNLLVVADFFFFFSICAYMYVCVCVFTFRFILLETIVVGCYTSV